MYFPRTDVLDIEERLHGSVRKEFRGMNVPRIATIAETLDWLLTTDRSLARFGESELIIASRRDDNPSSLSYKLSKVLSTEPTTCDVALNRAHFYWNEYMNAGVDGWFCNTYKDIAIANDHFSMCKLPFYWDSGMSIPVHMYSGLRKEYIDYFFDRAASLFRGKDVVFVTGDEWLEKVEGRIVHDNASSIFEIRCPHRNAYSEYNEMKDGILKANKDGDKLVVLCCGASAAALAFELSPYMRVLDMGHLPKEYNHYLRGIINDPNIRFWD